jgi:hypothetical protein
MSSIQINTSETINQINQNNDSKQNLGDGDKTVRRQEQNGFDLLCCSEFSNSLSFDTLSFAKLNPPNYIDEMTEYENAKYDYEKAAVLKKYQEITQKVNESVQSDTSSNVEYSNENPIENFTSVPELNYEDMYKDNVCTFFIGSITVIGLFIVYKMVER